MLISGQSVHGRWASWAKLKACPLFCKGGVYKESPFFVAGGQTPKWPSCCTTRIPRSIARNYMGADGVFFSSLDFAVACGPRRCYLTINTVRGKAVEVSYWILLCSIFVKWNGILAKGSGVQLKIHVFEAVSVWSSRQLAHLMMQCKTGYYLDFSVSWYLFVLVWTKPKLYFKIVCIWTIIVETMLMNPH